MCFVISLISFLLSFITVQVTVRTLRELSTFVVKNTIILAQKRPDGELLPFFLMIGLSMVAAQRPKLSDPADEGGWIATGARWPGSLDRMVRRCG
jgi:hypothetical protein